ncbi:anti-sigma factor family protein [Haliangium ochraceum]|uniref:SNF2 superfamily protein n=1 Tax=Haliangium ochraceum (strain DSM 14365 / JCM 11303 / SMP-2) TaxID=502025 RepID=D0LKU4_HALO1|nr:zf-HC2 domain-containing protein [Haliangium ochraceum]ACY16664.1 SNF2 superfamily protein [Haliangium ochraceum DSM 14365]
MRCRDVEALASRYIDGELDDARASALRGHARECSPCRALLGDWLSMREAATEIDDPDPEPGLWDAVEQGLAEAEVADAHRPRVWLHWQALRPMLLPGAVVAAAAAALLTWSWRALPGAEPQAAAPQATLASARAAAAPAGAREAAAAAPRAMDSAAAAALDADEPLEFAAPAVAAASFEQRMGDELAAADAGYRATLRELSAIVASERATWPAAAAARLDERLAALTAEARAHERELAQLDEQQPDSLNPRSRDALYDTYRRQISLLQSVALLGPAGLDESQPGVHPLATGGRFR